MPKLQLKFSEVIQGEFSPKPLNLLLTFQVNCPGCFIYALPLVQNFYEKYSPNELNVFALSTAFEDFDLNTLENTKLLIETGEIIGETKKALGSYGLEKYPHPLEFPVLMDGFINRQDFLSPERVEEMCRNVPDFEAMSEPEQDSIKDQIHNYFNRYEKIPYTFAVNGFAGTPTWIIFDENFEILAHWFGHKSAEETEWIIISAKDHQQ